MKYQSVEGGVYFYQIQAGHFTTSRKWLSSSKGLYLQT